MHSTAILAFYVSMLVYVFFKLFLVWVVDLFFFIESAQVLAVLLYFGTELTAKGMSGVPPIAHYLFNFFV